MCDYSLHTVQSRDAEVGETLISTEFRGSLTRGFASDKDKTCAVCLKPGTELSFAGNVKYYGIFPWPRRVKQRVAIFRKVNEYDPHLHHDAIEFPDGKIVMVSKLYPGQKVTVLQLPAPKMQQSHPAKEETATVTTRRSVRV